MPNVHVAIYLRISEDRDDVRAGVGRQLNDCTATANRRWPGAEQEVYEDNDMSAWSGRMRPAWARLFSDVRGGIVHAVVGWNLDRMFARPRELEDFIDLCEQMKMHEVVTAQGDLDLTTHDGQLTARILVAVARKERDNISRRVKRAVEDRQARGVWHGGTPPYGYRADPDAPGRLAVHTGNAMALRWAAERIMLGDPLLRVVKEWHEVHPMARKPATTLSLRWALLNPAVIARTRAATPAQWPPILSNELWSALSYLLLDTRRSSAVSRVRKYWLSGLLRCGKCEVSAPMATRPNRGDRRYLCLSCMNGISAHRTEQAIEELLFAAIILQKGQQPIRGVELVEDEVHHRLADLTALYVRGEVTREEWRAGRAEAQALQGPVSPIALPLPVDITHEWLTMDVQRRHSLAVRALEYVTVMPTRLPNRFDPTRLHPCWRA